jgi:hypothetical protein
MRVPAQNKTQIKGRLVFGNYTKEQLRQAYAEAWQKHVAGIPMSPLEAMIADVIQLHPEYEQVLQDLKDGQVSDVAAGNENPFLHMGLHMAVREQLSIDRPPGIRILHERLRARLGTSHKADHVLMDALAETLWEAQRHSQAPDEQHYLRLASKYLQN